MGYQGLFYLRNNITIGTYIIEHFNKNKFISYHSEF